MPARLVVRPSQGARREVTLDADVITIGRSPDCDVVLDVSYISRVHARIEARDSRYVLVDSGSTNGTGTSASGRGFTRGGTGKKVR